MNALTHRMLTLLRPLLFAGCANQALEKVEELNCAAEVRKPATPFGKLRALPANCWHPFLALLMTGLVVPAGSLFRREEQDCERSSRQGN